MMPQLTSRVPTSSKIDGHSYFVCAIRLGGARKPTYALAYSFRGVNAQGAQTKTLHAPLHVGAACHHRRNVEEAAAQGICGGC